jgi:tetrahydromethanopterin S-methyltransferase subunit A
VFVEDKNQLVKLDPAGYFVIYPIAERGVIHLEHYGYDNQLLHTLEGASPRAIYLKIIEQGWVTEMSHAAYLGKELIKAEFSLRIGIDYKQDAA